MELTIALPLGVVRSLLTSDFGTGDSALGQQVRWALGQGPETKLGGTRAVSVSVIPDGWAHLTSWLAAHSRHPVGAPFDVVRRANSFANLERRISRELQRLSNHPAYKELGVPGVVREELAAWRCSTATRSFPTYGQAKAACRGGEITFGRLVPSIESHGQRRLTVWRWEPGFRDQNVPSHIGNAAPTPTGRPNSSMPTSAVSPN